MLFLFGLHVLYVQNLVARIKEEPSKICVLPAHLKSSR